MVNIMFNDDDVPMKSSLDLYSTNLLYSIPSYIIASLHFVEIAEHGSFHVPSENIRFCEFCIL